MNNKRFHKLTQLADKIDSLLKFAGQKISDVDDFAKALHVFPLGKAWLYGYPIYIWLSYLFSYGRWSSSLL